MSTETKALEKAESRIMEYIPLGCVDKIKLTVKIVQDFIAVPTKKGETCTEDQAVRFILFCQAQRLNPFNGDAYLIGYDTDKGPKFNLIGSHAALLKRAESAGEDYEGMESGIIYREEKEGAIKEREGDFTCPPEVVIGGWARVYRKGRKSTYRRLSVAAMMPNYPTPFWSPDKMPGQIVKCSEADALRSTFPALCGNLFIEGERSVDISSAVVEERRPELTGHTRALNAPQGTTTTEPPKKRGRPPAEEKQTAAPTTPAAPSPKPEPEPKPEQKANPPGLEPETEPEKPVESSNGEFKPRPNETEQLTNVRRLLHTAKKTEDDLIKLGIEKRFIREGQKLSDLSTSKHEAIIAAFDRLLPDMK